MSAHLPLRPSWRCAGCSRHWPCETRRRELLAEYDGAPVSLALYMASQFVDASQDEPGDERAADLYARFFGWLRPRPPH